jgi:nitric oxide reductase NorE protein
MRNKFNEQHLKKGDKILASTQSSLPKSSPKPLLRVPGDNAMWIFIWMELITFAIFFVLFALAKKAQPVLFTEGRDELNVIFGAVNTVVLLAGGFFAVCAVRHLHARAYDMARRLLLFAMGTGILFLVIKIVEYAQKMSAGIDMSTSDFFFYYYFLTFVHFAHVLLGSLILLLSRQRIAEMMQRDASEKEDYEVDLRAVESGASYWHMVDIVWVILFPLVYLI